MNEAGLAPDGDNRSPDEGPQVSIVAAYEAYLDRFGDSYLGVGWTKSQAETDRRYEVMLGVIRESEADVSLLDFGCGLSHLYEYALRTGRTGIQYSGLDLSEKFLAASRAKFPDMPYYQLDVTERPDDLPSFDYVVLNGVFTLKAEHSHEQMWGYVTEVIASVFAKAERGIAFNMMSKQVDWERDDLFHVPFDALATFLSSQVSRHFVIRHDYGLYEYTVYVYRQA